MTCTLTSRFDCHHQQLGPSLADACPGGSSIFVFMSLLNSLIRKNEIISGLCERVVPVEETDHEYDFVVIGGPDFLWRNSKSVDLDRPCQFFIVGTQAIPGGGAGSVVAGRLSEVHSWKVLLLEAGPDEPAGAQIPGLTLQYLNSEIIWNYTTSTGGHACLSTNGSCVWRSGKNMGGNTVHNGMIYVRGDPADYNNWAEEGNVGWTWEEVEPFFKKAEDNGEIDRVGRKHHGTGGPLSVERFSYVPPLGHALLKASEELGYGVSEDLNGDTSSGYSITQAMNKKGVRHSSARSYLWPAKNRTNLHISLNSQATRLIIENGKAVGVEYSKNGEPKRVYVTKEVILSGGKAESPHLLLLSGIGPKEHLESMDIEVTKDLPGVGENLHDHPCAIIPFTIDEPDTYDNNWEVAAEYLTSQTGPLASTGMIPVVGMLPSSVTKSESPDFLIYFYGYVSNCAPGEVGALQSSGRRSVELLPSYVHPKSRGRITLASKDPFVNPVIQSNYLSHPDDVDRMVEGMRITLALLQDTKALRDYNFTLTESLLEACASNKFNSDEYWACVARQQNFHLCHEGGTSKMGPSSDPMAVVDPRLRVHGIRGLRVADNSIMPQPISANMASPAMMIGERAAHFIKEDWSRNLFHETCPYGV